MDERFRHCEQLVRSHDKDRYLASLFAPAEARSSLFALYAFANEIATTRDRAREPMPGEIRLQWWRDVLAGERTGEASANPVASCLVDIMARHGLAPDPFLDLIEAQAFDLYDDPMPTLASLESYARKTSSTVFEQAGRIVGDRDNPAIAEAALSAGVAWGMTQTLRAVARHASRGQVYLPIAMMERHGARLEDVLAGTTTPALRAVLAELRAEARRHLAAYEAALPGLPVSAAPAYLVLALVPGYLGRMEAKDYDPFQTPVELPQWRRQWTLWRAARRYSGLLTP